MNIEKIRISQLPEASSSEIDTELEIIFNTSANQTKKKSWAKIAKELGLSFGARAVGGAVNAQDHDFILADASAGAFTVTLPTPVASAEIVVKKTDATANGVTITGVAGFIDGNASLLIVTPMRAVRLFCDGTNWWIN